MQATITYCLTEAAQRAQMAATGQPVARTQQTTVDITSEDLQYLSLDENGLATLDLTKSDRVSRDLGFALQAAGWTAESRAQAYGVDVLADIRRGVARQAECRQIVYDAANAYVLSTDSVMLDSIISYGTVAMPRAAVSQSVLAVAKNLDRINTSYDNLIVYASDLSPEAQAVALDRYQRHTAAIAVAQNAAIDAFMADPERREYSVSYHGQTISLGGCEIAQQHQRYEDLFVEIERRNAADKADKAAREAAREKAKMDYIESWMASNADTDTQNQYDDGLLCRSAAVNLISSAAFEAAGVPAAVTVPDVCNNRDCPCCDSTVECIPRRLYPVWRAIKAGLPKDSSAEFSKVRDCLRDDDGYVIATDETAGPAYYTATITLPHGPFQFERRIKL